MLTKRGHLVDHQYWARKENFINFDSSARSAAGNSPELFKTVRSTVGVWSDSAAGCAGCSMPRKLAATKAEARATFSQACSFFSPAKSSSKIHYSS